MANSVDVPRRVFRLLPGMMPQRPEPRYVPLWRREEDGVEPLTVQQIYEQYAEFVWKALQRFGIRGLDCEDLLHEVFIKVHQEVPADSGRIETWLRDLSWNVARTHRRRLHSRREIPTNTDPSERLSQPSGLSPEQELETHQERGQVDEILDELDLEMREVLIMHYKEELPYDTIAHILGIPIGTVGSRIARARAAFEKAYNKRNRPGGRR